MPSAFRDPKSLPEWIELDYYRRVRPLRRLRSLVNWVVLLVSVAALAGVVWWGNQMIYQAAPVAYAHRMFNNDCKTCHTEAFQTTRRLLPTAAQFRSVPDQACQSCHAGAIHHPQQVRDDHCAACHQEHRGWPSLSRVPDGTCTDCHANLERKDRQPPIYFKSVTGFRGGEHPEFAWFRPDTKRPDPGTIRFNHKVHLADDGVFAPDPKQIDLLWKDAAADYRPVKQVLNCRDCHQPDAAGRYMQPVRYEQHCQKCHPLSVQVGGDWADEKVREAAKEFSRTPAPHPHPDETPETVRAALRDRFVRFLQINSAEKVLAGRAEPARPIPGWDRSQPLSREEYAWVNDQLAAAVRTLFDMPGGCRFCHEVKDQRSPPELPVYAPSNINERPFPEIGTSPRWLPHSIFNHERHRMLDCQQCHPAKNSSATGDVLLPAVESCQQCHNPRAGVRSDCVECHRYHDRAGERAYKGPYTIEEALGLQKKERPHGQAD
jgi:hypothetical protein